MAGISKHDSKLVVQHAIASARNQGLTQKDLAKELGLEESRLSEAKKGAFSILPSTRDHVFKMYGVPRRGKGQFVEAETYVSVDEFIETYPVTTQMRHLFRLTTTFSRKDYISIICGFFSVNLDLDASPDVQEEMKTNLINCILIDERFTQWGKNLHKYLSQDADPFDEPQTKPVLPKSLIDDIKTGLKSSHEQLFNIRGNEKEKSADFISAFYWLWYTKAKCPSFEFGSSVTIDLPATKELILTGDLILDGSYETEKARNINDALTVQAYEQYHRRDSLGHVPAYSRNVVPELSISQKNRINSKPDLWPQTHLKLYLSESMEYHLWIILDRGYQYPNYPDMMDRRNIVIPHIPWNGLFKAVEKIRKWVGLPYSPEKDIKEKIAEAGGYVPGAEVL